MLRVEGIAAVGRILRRRRTSFASDDLRGNNKREEDQRGVDAMELEPGQGKRERCTGYGSFSSSWSQDASTTTG